MKITILGSAHPLRGGLAAFNERLAEQLAAEGHEVDIVSFSLQYPSVLFPGKTQFSDGPAPTGLRIRSLVNSINPLSWLKVGRMLRRERADLLIVKFWLPFMGPAFGTVLRQVKKNGHTRVLSILDNFIPHEARPGDAAFTRYFARPVDAFLTMSREVLKDVQTALPQKPARFTPHPIYDSYGMAVPRDEACRKLSIDPSNKYVLFFGFIRTYKGLDLLLKAFAEGELSQDPSIQLLIAGEYYGDSAPYDALIAEHRLEGRVHRFTDFIPNDEVRYYFSAADLVAQPYKTATQSGITQIAYQFEKPMVVTNVGGLPEVVPDGKVGYVVPPEPTAIAAAIARFFAEGAGEKMRAAIVAEKRKYSWEAFTMILLKTVGLE